jgi:hypothetical protein
MAKVGINFPGEHSEELKLFVYEALQYSYNSDGESNDFDSPDGRAATFYESEDQVWSFEDTFFGDTPYSGISTVFYNRVACWSMVYWGRILRNDMNKEHIFECLLSALKHAPTNHPFRGPSYYKWEDDLTYINNWHGGDITSFHGEEYIKYSGQRVFETHYRGGVINRR